MNKISFSIWGLAVLLYLIFLGWHENWRGALTEEEIAHYMELIESNEELDDRQRLTLMKFMREDEGREFFMINLVAFARDKVRHPTSGELISGPDLLQEYFRPFAGMILRNAGYPAYSGSVRGDYIESWGVEASPSWQVAGIVRYRSRRDLLQAATNPAFDGIHIYKRAALVATLALPVDSGGGILFSPRVWVALVLVALAAIGHLGWLVLRGSYG